MSNVEVKGKTDHNWQKEKTGRKGVLYLYYNKYLYKYYLFRRSVCFFHYSIFKKDFHTILFITRKTGGEIGFLTFVLWKEVE